MLRNSIINLILLFFISTNACAVGLTLGGNSISRATLGGTEVDVYLAGECLTCETCVPVIGNTDSVSANTVTSSNKLNCFRFSASCSGVVNTMYSVVTGLGDTEDATMGIYSDKTVGCADSEPHCPGVLLQDTGAFSGNGASNNVVSAVLDSNLMLEDGSEYWLCEGDTNYQSHYIQVELTGGDSCVSEGDYASDGTLNSTITCSSPGTLKGRIWAISQ